MMRFKIWWQFLITSIPYFNIKYIANNKLVLPIQKRLVVSKWIYVRTSLAQNRYLDSDVQRVLALKGCDTELVYLAGNPCITQEVQDMLVANKYLLVVEELSLNPCISQKTQINLAEHYPNQLSIDFLNNPVITDLTKKLMVRNKNSYPFLLHKLGASLQTSNKIRLKILSEDLDGAYYGIKNMAALSNLSHEVQLKLYNKLLVNDNPIDLGALWSFVNNAHLDFDIYVKIFYNDKYPLVAGIVEIGFYQKIAQLEAKLLQECNLTFLNLVPEKKRAVLPKMISEKILESQQAGKIL